MISCSRCAMIALAFVPIAPGKDAFAAASLYAGSPLSAVCTLVSAIICLSSCPAPSILMRALAMAIEAASWFL